MAKPTVCEICKAKIQTGEGYYSVNKKSFCPVCYQRQDKVYATKAIKNTGSIKNGSKNLYDEFMNFRIYNTWLEKIIGFY